MDFDIFLKKEKNQRYCICFKKSFFDFEHFAKDLTIRFLKIKKNIKICMFFTQKCKKSSIFNHFQTFFHLFSFFPLEPEGCVSGLRGSWKFQCCFCDLWKSHTGHGSWKCLCFADENYARCSGRCWKWYKPLFAWKKWIQWNFPFRTTNH